MGLSTIDPQLPLIDLHRHIDGSVRLTTILELGKKHGVKLPGTTPKELRPHVQVMERQPGVMAFISKMLWMTAVMVTPMLVNGLRGKMSRTRNAKGSITSSCDLVRGS